MFLSRRHRLLGALLLAAGAAASIATSQVQWDLTEHYDLEPLILDETTPSADFAVHVEYTGNIPEPEGNLSVSLTVELEPLATTAYLHAQIVDDATQTIVDEVDFTYDTTVTGPQGPWLSATAWEGCTDGCSQDFTLRISRTDPITDAAWPQARITGTIDAYLAEYGKSEAPAGASLTLEVTPL